MDEKVNQNGEIIAPTAFMGAMPMRKYITILPADNPEKLRLGWVVFEEIGEAHINHEAINEMLKAKAKEQETYNTLTEYMKEYAK